jgi:hypothetical protein
MNRLLPFVLLLPLLAIPPTSSGAIGAQEASQKSYPKLTKEEKKKLKTQKMWDEIERKAKERGYKTEKERDKQKQRDRDEQERYTPAWACWTRTMEEIRNALVYKVTMRGYGIAGDTTYQLSFWREVTGGTGFLTQLLLGSAYSETPKQIITFTLIPREGQVMVRVTALVMVRMPLGNINTADLTYNRNVKRDLQATLDTLFDP